MIWYIVLPLPLSIQLVGGFVSIAHNIEEYFSLSLWMCFIMNSSIF